MKHSSTFALVLVAAALLPACGGGSGGGAIHPPGPPVVPDFPRLGIYAGTGSVGFPFVLPDGSLDPVTLDQWAKHHQVITHATPLCDLRTDIVPALRERNPDLSIIAYVMASFMWPGGGYPTSSYYYHYWDYLNDGPQGTPGPDEHFLYWQDGRRCDDVQVIANLAEVEDGRFAVAESIAEMWHRDIVSTGLFNGIYLDVYVTSCEWLESPANQFDYLRAGYPTKEAFFEGWRQGAARMGNRLRELCGPDFVIIGNAGQPPASLHGSFNGWMRENFPLQNGGTWYSNMYRNPGGMFVDDRQMRPRQHNYIFTAAEPTTAPYSSWNRRKVRYGLGSASLTEGFAVFGDGSGNTNPASGGTRYDLWWYDEYAVDVATGASSTQPAHTGWLGKATSEAYQQVWANAAPDAIANPGFETDTAGWTFVDLSPADATLSRDTVLPGEGTASAKVTILSPGSVTWAIYLLWPNDISFTGGSWYSLSFRARSAVARNISTSINPAAGQPWVYRTQRIGTEWSDLQLTFQALASGTGKLRIDVGGSPGDVWIDGVHVQEGSTHVYRRDFDNGIVLVNPDALAKTVDLGGSFRKILGSLSPEINDGSTVTSVVVGGDDAVFLLRP